MSRIKDYSNLPSLTDLIKLDEWDKTIYRYAVLSQCCQAPVVLSGMEHILNEYDWIICTKNSRCEGKDTRCGCQHGDYILELITCYVCTKCGKESDHPGRTWTKENTKEQYLKKREDDGY